MFRVERRDKRILRAASTGTRVSQMKNLNINATAKIKLAMTWADRHPEIDPEVTANTKMMRPTTESKSFNTTWRPESHLTCKHCNPDKVQTLECLFSLVMIIVVTGYEEEGQSCDGNRHNCNEVEHPWPASVGDQDRANNQAYHPELHESSQTTARHKPRTVDYLSIQVYHILTQDVLLPNAVVAANVRTALDFSAGSGNMVTISCNHCGDQKILPEEKEPRTIMFDLRPKYYLR
jgi:hypothetical protein